MDNSTQLSKTFMNIFNILKEYDENLKNSGQRKSYNRLTMNLSGYNSIYKNDRWINISPFHTLKSANGYYCVICKKKAGISYTGALNDLQFVIHRGQSDIYCYCCEVCHYNKKRICPNTFMDTDYCICWKGNMLCLFWCIAQLNFNIPQDIKIYIYNMAKSTRCC